MPSCCNFHLVVGPFAHYSHMGPEGKVVDSGFLQDVNVFPLGEESVTLRFRSQVLSLFFPPFQALTAASNRTDSHLVAESANRFDYLSDRAVDLGTGYHPPRMVVVENQAIEGTAFLEIRTGRYLCLASAEQVFLAL